MTTAFHSPSKPSLKERGEEIKKKEEGISWQASGYNSGLSLPTVQVGSLVRGLSVYVSLIYIYIYV